jgi:two-component system, response regulator YesN
MVKSFLKKLSGDKSINKTLFYKLLVYFSSLFVLIIVSLGFTFVLISGKTFKKQITNYAADNLNQINHNIDRSLFEADKSMINLAFDNTILTLIHNKMSYGYMYTEYDEASRILGAVKSTSSLLDSIYLYIKVDEKVITSSKQIYDMSEFPEMSWLNEFEDSDEKNQVFIKTNPIINPINRQKMNVISIVRVLPIINRSNERGVLVYNIDEEILNQVINRKKIREKESVFIVDSNGKIISTENKKDLYQTYQWSEELSSMEGSSGNLIKDINDVKSFIVYDTIEKYNWKTISITPYNEIFAVQNRLNAASVFVCILCLVIFTPIIVLISRRIYSPISSVIGILTDNESSDKSTVNNDMTFINDSIRRIITDKKMLDESFKTVVPAARENFFANLISGYFQNEESINEKMKTLGIEFKKGCFSVMLVEIDNIVDIIDVNNEASRKKLLSELKKQTLDYMRNTEYKAEVVEVNDYRIAVILNYALELEKDSVYYMCLDLKETLIKNNKYTVTIGLGRVSLELANMKSSYDEALRSVKHKLVFGKNNVIRVSDIEKDLQGDAHVKNDYIRSILKHLRLGDMDLCVSEINSMIDMMRDNGTETLKMYKFLVSFVNSIFFTLYDMGTSIDEIFGKEYDLVDSFIKNEDINDIKNWFHRIFHEIGTYMEQKKKSSSNDAITKVKSYILQNYAKEVTLNDIATLVFLNPSYLGKLFKKVEGVTFNEFLNNVRMEKAKELLLKSNMKIGEIAEAIGINNSRYFTYCFKSCYGVTPKAFRGNNTLDEYDGSDEEE